MSVITAGTAAPREMEYGSHVFVLARPKVRDWQHYDGTTMRQGNEEFRPCMIRGHDSGQRIWVIGSAYAYMPEDFEFGPDVPASV